MSLPAPAVPAPPGPVRAPNSRKSVYMVVGCTLFASAAQILLKMGAGHEYPVLDLGRPGTLVDFALALLSNVPLVFGFAFHACNALLLIFALRGGELSILWPIYALSYVWVALLSSYFFGEHVNVWKVGGIALIILGVALLGRASAATPESEILAEATKP